MTFAPTQTPNPIDEDAAWRVLLALRRRAQSGSVLSPTAAIRLDDAGVVREVETGDAWIQLRPGAHSWRAVRPVQAPAAALFDLYLPLCAGSGGDGWAVAHLGQSLDGRIATEDGESQYVTGPESVAHMHRMRALADAVVVGRHTVELDDPRLTTRLVTGDSPVRVVIDPRRRLGDDHRLFRDGSAPTVVLCTEQGALERRAPGAAELVIVPENEDGRLSAHAVLTALESRGLRRVFIEGGGVTVSHFLEQRCLHRLHVTVAPTILGSGRQGLQLSSLLSLKHALRPRARRFSLGEDVLFDCDFTAVRWKTH